MAEDGKKTEEELEELFNKFDRKYTECAEKFSEIEKKLNDIRKQNLDEDDPPGETP